jgi:hypothetical protein
MAKVHSPCSFKYLQRVSETLSLFRIFGKLFVKRLFHPTLPKSYLCEQLAFRSANITNAARVMLRSVHQLIKLQNCANLKSVLLLSLLCIAMMKPRLSSVGQHVINSSLIHKSLKKVFRTPRSGLLLVSQLLYSVLNKEMIMVPFEAYGKFMLKHNVYYPVKWSYDLLHCGFHTCSGSLQSWYNQYAFTCHNISSQIIIY